MESIPLDLESHVVSRVPSSPRQRHQRLAAGAVGGLLALLAGVARAETWIVDDNGPANFRDVQSAVAAAADGDTLLLRPGEYGPIELSRKGLRIIGSGPGQVTLRRSEGEGPAFSAQELNTRQDLVLSGIHCIGRGATITIERCSGRVILSDLVVESRHPKLAAAGPVLEHCTRAWLARVAILPDKNPSTGGALGLSLTYGTYTLTQVVAVGSPGTPASSPLGKGGAGDVGLAVTDAKVYAALCEFVGGDGGPALWDARAPGCPEAATGGTGGSGVLVSGKSELTLVGNGSGSLRGGRGGAATENPWAECWSYAGNGGAGLRLRIGDDAPKVTLDRIDLIPGDSGIAEGRRAGVPGPPFDGDETLVSQSAATIPTLSIDEPGVSGGPFHLRVRGTPGDLVTLLVSTEFGQLKMKGTKGFPLQAVPGGIWIHFPQGRIPAEGVLVTDALLPNVQELVGRTLALQAILIPPPQSDRASSLSNTDVLTVADGSEKQTDRN